MKGLPYFSIFLCLLLLPALISVAEAKEKTDDKSKKDKKEEKTANVQFGVELPDEPPEISRKALSKWKKVSVYRIFMDKYRQIRRLNKEILKKNEKGNVLAVDTLMEQRNNLLREFLRYGRTLRKPQEETIKKHQKIIETNQKKIEREKMDRMKETWQKRIDINQKVIDENQERIDFVNYYLFLALKDPLDGGSKDDKADEAGEKGKEKEAEGKAAAPEKKSEPAAKDATKKETSTKK